MRVLLVHGAFPVTYWGFQHGLALVGKSAAFPPLGLVTLAAHLPPSWELRLVDLNVAPLGDEDLRWADVVMVGGMLIQARSMHEVLGRARELGKRTVVGGPAANSSPETFGDADVVFSGEIEGREAELLQAVEDPARGTHHLKLHKDRLPSLSLARVPRFDLIDFTHYSSMSIQSSRGCPFSCEFCDVIEVFGRFPRVKAPAQVLAELERLTQLGWRGSVFIVDDNFIGNPRQAKSLVAALGAWRKQHGAPADFYTEASVNLASQPELARAMVDAGFSSVFLGLETPSKAALAEAGKGQNLKLDLRAAVATLTRIGLEVMGGYIVGFDSDGPEVFDAQRRFILDAPIPHAMLGLLVAMPGTALARRVEREGRLRTSSSGDQLGRSNFVPRMNEAVLLRGYASLLADLYRPDNYVRRCLAYLAEAPLPEPVPGHASWQDLMTLARVIFHLGIVGKWRRSFWRLMARALARSPRHLRWAVSHAIQGEHFIRYTHETVLPRLAEALAEVERERAAARAA